MKFCDWRTHFDFTRSQIRLVDPRRDINLEQYTESYAKYYLDPTNNTTLYFPDKDLDLFYIVSEIKWMEIGRPYYNIHPNIIMPAQRMKIDRIPVSMLEMPAELDAVLIRFPDNHEFTKIDAIFLGKRRQIIQLFVKTNDKMAYVSIPTNAEMTVSDAIANAHQFSEEHDITIIQDAIRFYCLVKFLSNVPNSELVEYDVVNKYKAEYSVASPARKKEIEERSKKLGKVGWNIGVNCEIIRNCPRLSEDEEYNVTGRQQHFAHIRTGHIHAVRFGQGKKDVKIMWYRPILVNKDKPFKL